tara:strand:+ start:1025 stop:1177 length:153 start_codon:yes stop_codon:yes gene_type:complete
MKESLKLVKFKELVVPVLEKQRFNVLRGDELDMEVVRVPRNPELQRRNVG